MNVVKNVCNFKGIIETTRSTNIIGDGKFDFLSILAGSSGESSKEVDQFVFWGGE